MPKIIKIGQCFTELFQNINSTFFLRHGVYTVSQKTRYLTHVNNFANY